MSTDDCFETDSISHVALFFDEKDKCNYVLPSSIFILQNQTYCNHLQDLNFHPIWMTEDTPSHSLFYLDKELSMCMQGFDVGHRTYKSVIVSLFSDYNDIG